MAREARRLPRPIGLDSSSLFRVEAVFYTLLPYGRSGDLDNLAKPVLDIPHGPSAATDLGVNNVTHAAPAPLGFQWGGFCPGLSDLWEGGLLNLKINADGSATKSVPRRAGAGVVVHNQEGETLAELAVYLGDMDHHQAEYMCLILGLLLADALGADESEVRLDSRLVCAQVSGYRGSRPWRVKAVNLRRMSRLAARMVDVSRTRLEWVPRDRNKEADRLANHGAKRGWLGPRG